MVFKKIISVYSEQRMKRINTLCEQNADLLIVEVSGTYSCHRALKC
jgi:hypothetical protein